MFRIGSKIISYDSPTYIIAEVGVNHNGSLEMAEKLIEVAKQSGADAVKFQTFKSEKLVSKSAKKAKYQTVNTDEVETQLEMLKKLEFSHEEFKYLKKYCDEQDIEFLSTPFDEESADFLKEIGVHAFKIGSGDLTNLPLLKKIAKFNVPILLSTGMANLGEIEEAVHVLEHSEFALLHCTSNYPAPVEEVNLKAMETMAKAFGKIVGYSDHTEGDEITISSVALGAKIIEKHFTLDRKLPGPDHAASIIPSELSNLVTAIRRVEKSMGDGIKRCTPSEVDTKNVARKSLVALTELQRGTILTEGNLGIKRPGNGIEPKHYEKLLGKAVKNHVNEDNVIEWDDVL
ncbi:N-acetylneuraminate synthase [Radiobacillus kanasensis]|uniref:N-acetylneuraminate synthase n=1 Tax=Radiobacillus kanasensis TaxID=2844358 RepID=UPI001E2DB864|nr:N-acetylneuraminate synthase [Radiobacillus kanasensis]UFT98887.1 N-acetylneuraminate synthase [Radiobacillus kanasensis]